MRIDFQKDEYGETFIAKKKSFEECLKGLEEKYNSFINKNDIKDEEWTSQYQMMWGRFYIVFAFEKDSIVPMDIQREANECFEEIFGASK